MRDDHGGLDRPRNLLACSPQIGRVCRVHRHSDALAVHDGVERAAVGDVGAYLARPELHNHPAVQHERRHAGVRHTLDARAGQPCAHAHGSGRRVENNRGPIAARHQQTARQRDRRHADDARA